MSWCIRKISLIMKRPLLALTEARLVSNYFFLCSVLLSSFISFFSCNINNSPNDNSNVRRDYKWTIDTLSYYNSALALWGSSADDIWAVTNGYENRDNLMHYNGKKWSRYLSKIIQPWGIYGFGNSNVYLCTTAGKIMHFNGSSWELYLEISKENEARITLHNLWGRSPSQIYAFGATEDSTATNNISVIASIQNNSYNLLNTSSIKGYVYKCFQDIYDQKLYIATHKFSDSSFVYEYSGFKFTELIATTWRDQSANIALINGRVYFVRKNEILMRNGSGFKQLLTVPGNFGDVIWGRSEIDIFLEMLDGIAHYNGIDIEYLVKFNDFPAQIRSAVLFEKDVYFLIYEGTTHLSLVYHGKLE
jgi:hypothetical protein